MTKAAVIGAGVGGLSAAIELASAGVEVHIFEALSRAGGKAGTITLEGVEVDTGPSVLTLPDVFRTLLAKADASLSEALELIEPEPAFRYLYPDGVQLDVFGRLPDTLDAIAHALGAQARQEFERYLIRAQKVWEAAAPHFVYGEAPTVQSVARLGWQGLVALTRIDGLRSYWHAIEADVKEPHLRWLLARYATYNGSDVRVAPATLSCIAHVELGLGGYGIRGGIGELIRLLVAAAERLGVRVHLASPVTRIEPGWTVHVGGERFASDFVVVNADAAHLTETLLPQARAHITPAPASMSGWTGILRSVRNPKRVAHTVVFPEDYLAEFADIFDRGVAPTAPTVYLCAQNLAHGRQTWPDAEPVFVMANAPAEPEHQAQSPDAHPILAQRVKERLHASGLWSSNDRLLWSRTPTDLASTFPGTRGALYGAASNSRWSAFRRPPNRLRAFPGLYLASGSAHPGGGLPLCALSGKAAAKAALLDLERR